MKLIKFFAHKAYIVSVLFTWNINPKFTASLIFSISLFFNLISLINILNLDYLTNYFLKFTVFSFPFLLWLLFVYLYSDELILNLKSTYKHESIIDKVVGIIGFILYVILSFFFFIVSSTF